MDRIRGIAGREDLAAAIDPRGPIGKSVGAIQGSYDQAWSDDRTDGWTAPELAARLGVAEDAETLFHVLEHLAANGRVAAKRIGAACATRYHLPLEDQRA